MKVVTDWEGPWVTNDFAYEICSKLFSPEFFRKLSSYDDYLAYEVKKPEYNPGDTLRLIAPFIVAKGVTSEWLRRQSRPIYVKNAFASVRAISSFEVVVASTAYEQFLEVSCKKLGLKYAGTRFIPESYSMSESERRFLLDSVERVVKADFEWLDDFFKELENFETSGRILREVKVMGGKRKKEVAEFADVCVGDSISDSQMLKHVAKKGLAISFNGNRFALENANLAVVSDTTLATSLAIRIYWNDGIDGIKRLCESRDCYHWIPDLTKDEFEELVSLSESMRKKVRGDAGELG